MSLMMRLSRLGGVRSLDSLLSLFVDGLGSRLGLLLLLLLSKQSGVLVRPIRCSCLTLSLSSSIHSRLRHIIMSVL